MWLTNFVLGWCCVPDFQGRLLNIVLNIWNTVFQIGLRLNVGLRCASKNVSRLIQSLINWMSLFSFIPKCIESPRLHCPIHRSKGKVEFRVYIYIWVKYELSLFTSCPWLNPLFFFFPVLDRTFQADGLTFYTTHWRSMGCLIEYVLLSHVRGLTMVVLELFHFSFICNIFTRILLSPHIGYTPWLYTIIVT